MRAYTIFRRKNMQINLGPIVKGNILNETAYFRSMFCYVSCATQQQQQERHTALPGSLVCREELKKGIEMALKISGLLNVL